MKEIITITGEVGSGKSTVGRMLATWLAYEHISTGTIQRRFAAERGCTPLELNEASMRDGKIDEVIDSYLRGLNQSGNRLVLDSRLAWHFVERAFDVFSTSIPARGLAGCWPAGGRRRSTAAWPTRCETIFAGSNWRTSGLPGSTGCSATIPTTTTC